MLGPTHTGNDPSRWKGAMLPIAAPSPSQPLQAPFNRTLYHTDRMEICEIAVPARNTKDHKIVPTQIAATLKCSAPRNLCGCFSMGPGSQQTGVHKSIGSKHGRTCTTLSSHLVDIKILLRVSKS